MTSIKPSILLSSYHSIHAFTPSAPTCSTSLRGLSARDPAHPKRKRIESQRRAYASVASEHSSNHFEKPWPETLKGHTCPTPYQIFDIERNAPYSKARFYQLVKLYHPDRSSHSLSGDDAAIRTTKLERYRLVVTAHAILSDPAKRSAYDRWGAGWAGKTDSPFSSAAHGASRPRPGPFSSWHDGGDPHIWANATWEDWERWRVRQDPHSAAGQQTGPVYMRNSYFVSMILAVALVGSSLNYNRADHEGERFLAARDAIHDKASKELRRVRQETGSRAKEERIEWFLRNREAQLMGMGVEELREDKARRWLPEQESCMSEDMRSQEPSPRDEE